MALPPLPPDNTARLLLNYTGASGDHTVQLRLQPGVGISDALTVADYIARALAGCQWSSATWGVVEFIPQGTNVSNPIGTLTVVGANSGEPAPDKFPAFLSFYGRSTDGRKCDWTLYETSLYPDGDYRVFAGDSAAVNAAIAAFVQYNGYIATISGLTPLMRNYANMGYNAYYQKKRRG